MAPAVGGVCANLDYEVDQMADYVSEMTQRLILPGTAVSPAFRKFCSGLLQSTRLPSTTILLGMNYLARRMNTLKSNGPFKASEGQVWRMLTISLLLGSKFLDDNTFQNRSWSEVSSIPVSELNTLEHEWLESISWSLYVNLDKSKDFQAWIQSWNEWRQMKRSQHESTLERLAPLALTPIDTNVQRPRPYAQQYNGYQKSAPRERPQSGYNLPYEPTAWVHSYPTPPHLTPPSAPDSCLNTPEYLSATGGAPRYNDWAQFNQYPRQNQPQNLATYVQPRVPAYQLTPSSSYGMDPGHYTDIYSHSHRYGTRDPAIVDCGCSGCGPYSKQFHFYGHNNFGQPIVV